MPATKTFLEGMTNLALKKLKKLKKQADRDVAKEEKLSEKKFHPNESAEMDDLAVARGVLGGIEDEILKRTTSKSDLKKMGMDHLLKKKGGKLRGIGKALRGGGKVMRG